MDLFADFITTLLSIVVIDLVLAGDNAIVIGMAARNLPKNNQRKVILWGTIGAVAIRITATLAVVWLLKIPALLLAGGIVLLFIAYKLLVEEKDHEIEAKDHIFAAIRTIIVADAVMGLDNVLAVAGAAHGNFLLVVLGLIISVPIVVWGSTLFIQLMNKFPWILNLGAAILAWTGSKMIIGEPLLNDYFMNALFTYGFEAIAVIAVLMAGFMRKKWTSGQNVTG